MRDDLFPSAIDHHPGRAHRGRDPMTEPEKPARRPRYRGPNPRDFAEKYKEHRPDLYAEDVAKVIEAGKTPAGVASADHGGREVLEALRPEARRGRRRLPPSATAGTPWRIARGRPAGR